PAGQAVLGTPVLLPQTLAVPPPPHVSPVAQVPQLSMPPQPSEIVPQLSGVGHLVSGVQLAPQTLAVPPPPHVSPVGHVPPQTTMPPQLSEIVPQLSPAGQVVSGVQVLPPQAPAVPPPPQVSPVGHPLPLSPHVHLRQVELTVPSQIGSGVPPLTHLPCLLLQISCTTHVRPLTVIWSPGPPSSQMSASSPHWLFASYHPMGDPMLAVRPMSGSVTA